MIEQGAHRILSAGAGRELDRADDPSGRGRCLGIAGGGRGFWLPAS